MRFPGFTTLYEESVAESPKPDADAGGENRLCHPWSWGRRCSHLAGPNQHFTQPPPRFTEASLVNEFEKLGIGRPSTYASIFGTLRDRSTSKTRTANSFPRTWVRWSMACWWNVSGSPQRGIYGPAGRQARQIEEGQRDWMETLHAFYDPFVVDLQHATRKMRDVRKEVEETNEVCDKCSVPWSSAGDALAGLWPAPVSRSPKNARLSTVTTAPHPSPPPP